MRKHLLTGLLVMLLSLVQAQTRGNKTITKRTVNLPNITRIDQGLYASVAIKADAPNSYITITTDSNLQDKIDYQVKQGRLQLSQKDWIEGSKRIKIEIGAPNLEFISMNIHDTVTVINWNKESINAQAILGKIILEGNANIANFNVEDGVIIAKKMKINKAIAKSWGNGKIYVNAPKKLKRVQGDKYHIVDLSLKKTIKEQDQPKVKFIKFKIKNNSKRRQHFYVKGDNGRGGKFSYGFPMSAGAVRKENWSIGSVIYLEKSFGLNRKLITIKASDIGKTVLIFPKEAANK